MSKGEYSAQLLKNTSLKSAASAKNLLLSSLRRSEDC